MTGRRERGVREGTAAVLFPHLWQPVLKKTVKTVRGCQHNIGGDKGSATGVFEGAICCLETAKACGVRVPVWEGIGVRVGLGLLGFHGGELEGPALGRVASSRRPLGGSVVSTHVRSRRAPGAAGHRRCSPVFENRVDPVDDQLALCRPLRGLGLQGCTQSAWQVGGEPAGPDW